MEMGKGDVKSYCLFFICFVSCRLWRMAVLSCSYNAWVSIGNLGEEHAIVFIKLPKSNGVKNHLKISHTWKLNNRMCWEKQVMGCF